MGGIGIQAQHACFSTDDNKTTVKPLSNEAQAQVWVNGIKATSMNPITLKPNDRVIFGTGSAFLFRNQQRDSESGPVKDSPESPITYELAIHEKLENEEAEELARKADEKEKQDAEAAEKMAEIQKKMAAERAEVEAGQEKMRKQYEE